MQRQLGARKWRYSVSMSIPRSHRAPKTAPRPRAGFIAKHNADLHVRDILKEFMILNNMISNYMVGHSFHFINTVVIVLEKEKGFQISCLANRNIFNTIITVLLMNPQYTSFIVWPKIKLPQ